MHSGAQRSDMRAVHVLERSKIRKKLRRRNFRTETATGLECDPFERSAALQRCSHAIAGGGMDTATVTLLGIVVWQLHS